MAEHMSERAALFSPLGSMIIIVEQIDVLSRAFCHQAISICLWKLTRRNRCLSSLVTDWYFCYNNGRGCIKSGNRFIQSHFALKFSKRTQLNFFFPPFISLLRPFSGCKAEEEFRCFARNAGLKMIRTRFFASTAATS